MADAPAPAPAVQEKHEKQDKKKKAKPEAGLTEVRYADLDAGFSCTCVADYNCTGCLI